jgi:hypothetical protein
MNTQDESSNFLSYDVMRHHAQVVVARALCRCALGGIKGFGSAQDEIAAEPDVATHYEDYMDRADALVSMLLEVLGPTQPNSGLKSAET